MAASSDSPSLRRSLLDTHYEPEPQLSNMKILKDLLKIFQPTFGGAFLNHSTSLATTLLMSKYRNIDEYTASVYATSVGACLCLAIGYGMACGVDTLCSQAFGSREYRQAAHWLQRCRLIMVVIWIPLSLMLIPTQYILEACKVNPEVASMAAVLTRYFSVAYFFTFQYECMRHYLNVINLPAVGLISSLISLPVHVGVLSLLIFVCDWNYHACGVAYISSQVSEFVIIQAYFSYKTRQCQAYSRLKHAVNPDVESETGSDPDLVPATDLLPAWQPTPLSLVSINRVNLSARMLASPVHIVPAHPHANVDEALGIFRATPRQSARVGHVPSARASFSTLLMQSAHGLLPSLAGDGRASPTHAAPHVGSHRGSARESARENWIPASPEGFKRDTALAAESDAAALALPALADPDDYEQLYCFTPFEWHHARTRWGAYVKVAMPACIMICAEWMAFEFLIMEAGSVSTHDGAAAGLVYQLLMVNYMIPLSMATALAAYVGQCMGEGDYKAASRYVPVAMGLMGLAGAVYSGVIYFGRSWLIPLIANADEPGVHRVLDESMLYVAIYTFVDSFAGSLGGIVRGLGRQRIAAWANILGFYGINQPLAIYLVSRGFGSWAVWASAALGIVVQLFGMLYACFSQNWAECAKNARARVEAEALLIEQADAAATAKATTNTVQRGVENTA